MNNRDIRIGRLQCLEIFDEELCRLTGGVEAAIRERDDVARGKRLRPFAYSVHPVIVITERNLYFLRLCIDVVLLLRDNDGRSRSEPLHLSHLRHAHLVDTIRAIGKIRRDSEIERRIRHERARAHLAEFLPPRQRTAALDHRKPRL